MDFMRQKLCPAELISRGSFSPKFEQLLDQKKRSFRGTFDIAIYHFYESNIQDTQFVMRMKAVPSLIH